ncbi:MAG: hypothetical protein JNL08_20360 [Planctomycetes bacterium]|nr:hypothetical protein [Planctomycetota bacterium]
MHVPLSLMLCLCQGPGPQSAAPPALDVVVLKNGDRFEGRITAHLDGYVEVQLEAGAVVGLSTAEIAAVHRGAGAPSASAPALLSPSDEWFVLHDARGEAVGWLHAAVQATADGGASISEEYEFHQGRRRYQVTSLCTAAADGTPRSSYFRERVSEPLLGLAAFPVDGSGQAERIVDERIVEAVRDGDRLVVTRLDANGRRERTLPLPAGATFPLLARARARASGAALSDALLFDAATEELVVRTFAPARHRRVTVDGEPLQVTELVEESPHGRNCLWLDASLRTVRRELAGPALVAMPSHRDSARIAAHGTSIASAIVAEAGGAFGLWSPNPAWTPRPDLPAGQVVLTCSAHDASAALTQLDHLEPGTPLEAAADAVANWFRLLHPDLTIDGRTRTQLRSADVVRLAASGGSGANRVQATVDVVPHRGHFLVLVCRAPAAAWDELAADFAFLQRSVELEPQALTPTLQGPVAAREAPAAKANAPRAAAPVVRIPE